MPPVAPVPVFDIGQVLLQWQPQASLRRHFPDDAAIDAFMAEVGFMDLARPSGCRRRLRR